MNIIIEFLLLIFLLKTLQVNSGLVIILICLYFIIKFTGWIFYSIFKGLIEYVKKKIEES
jgi:hypothetical protein